MSALIDKIVYLFIYVYFCIWIRKCMYLLFAIFCTDKYDNFDSVFTFRNSVLMNKIQSTLVISKLKGSSETLRDIRTSTYQISRIEENTNRTTKFHK